MNRYEKDIVLRELLPDTFLGLKTV